MERYMISNQFFFVLLAIIVVFSGIHAAWKGLYKRKLQREQEERLRKKGEEGEETTAYFLRKIRGCKKILHHVYVPKSDGSGTTEIDLVILHKKGLIVVENKNYAGCIYGKEEDFYWTQILPDGEKRSFYSPVKQNGSHIRHLKRFLSGLVPYEIPFVSVITFNSQARLKRIWVDQENAVVTESSKIKRRLKKRLKRLPKVFGPRELEKISEYLGEHAGESRKTRRNHEKQVKNQRKAWR